MRKKWRNLAAVMMAAAMLAGTAGAQEASEETPWKNTNVAGAVTEEDEFEIQDDFYGTINRDWLLETKMQPSHPQENGFVELQEEVDEQLMELLEDRTLESHDAKLLQGLYDLFLDWDTRNAVGMSQVLPHLEQIREIGTLEDLTEYLLSEEALFFADALLPFSIGTQADDPTWYELQITTPGLSLGDAAEYEQMTFVGMMYKNALDQINQYLLQKAGYTEEEAKEVINQAFEFEKDIAQGMMSYAQLVDPEAVSLTVNPTSLEELKEMSPVYPLTEIMEADGFDGWERINLTQPKWLERMNEIYTEENVEKMKAYLIINYLQSSASIVDEETYREMQRISRQLSGITESDSDEKTAYSFASSCLTNSISRVYVEKYMTEETKQDITAIIEEVIATYREMLEQEDWLSEETRQMAIRKLDHIRINAAYPDKWEDTSDITFKTKEEGGTLSEALEALNRASYQKDYIGKMNQQVDPEIWMVGVTDVNAYYNPTDNSINIIAGILGDPFYSPEMSEEEKLAGIGMVIGHEISHAFDTSGAQYDENGALADWWTQEDMQAFNDRAEKLIECYDQIVPLAGDKNYSGALIQGEAIADMGGVKCMMEMAKNRDGFDYDKFFRAYAKVWRSKETLEYEKQLIQLDTHPLNYLRVNMTLMQIPEFYETYGIAEGDGMYMASEERIAVW